MSSRFYKYCIVPGCRNTTVTTPKKIFVNVPRVENLRKKWFKAMGKDLYSKNNVPISTKSARYCCEDHFDLENDMQHYLKWKLLGGNILMKKDVVPHIFDSRNSPSSSKEPMVEKSTPVQVPVLNDTNNLEKTVQRTGIQAMDSRNGFKPSRVFDDKSKARRRESTESKIAQTDLRRVNSSKEHSSPSNLSPPPKLSDSNLARATANNHMFLNNSAGKDQSLPEPTNGLETDPETQFQDIMLSGTIMSIQKDPKLYLGISVQTYCCLDILCQTIPCDHRDILVTLKKIRLNEPCTILATQFATSATIIEEILQRTVTLMSKSFKELIYWPTFTNVLKHLPIIFRSKYSKLYCMIDILEVEIQKIDNPLHQRLTWSKDKNCYTAKYLIACTPDGLFTYTSDGFGGRISDADIWKNCGLMEHLVPGTDIVVKAERSFKNVDHLLAQRSCKLIRLPTVRDPRNQEDGMETKSIEALRSNLQSAIDRLRDFKMLTLYNTRFDPTFISKLDDVVVIVLGLTNLQSSLDL